jgi:hypothetical protein
MITLLFFFLVKTFLVFVFLWVLAPPSLLAALHVFPRGRVCAQPPLDAPSRATRSCAVPSSIDFCNCNPPAVYGHPP